MKILVDSREQTPFTFERERYAGTLVEVGTLDTGDYSLAGLADRVAVERKTLPDLVSCLGQGRERFERELKRAASLEAFAVVVEASWAELAAGEWRSQLNPHAACQSVLAFTARWRIPFLFAGSREGAEYATWGFLRQYLEGARKRWGGIVRAHREAGYKAEEEAAKILEKMGVGEYFPPCTRGENTKKHQIFSSPSSLARADGRFS